MGVKALEIGFGFHRFSPFDACVPTIDTDIDGNRTIPLTLLNKEKSFVYPLRIRYEMTISHSDFLKKFVHPDNLEILM